MNFRPPLRWFFSKKCTWLPNLGLEIEPSSHTQLSGFLVKFKVFPVKTWCLQTHSAKQNWTYPLPTLCENFFWKMGLRNSASMAGFPKMEVNFHKFFSRISFKYELDRGEKCMQTIPNPTCVFCTFPPPWTWVSRCPSLAGDGRPRSEGIYINVEPDKGTNLRRNGSTR